MTFKKLSFSDVYNIEKYHHLDEGIEDIRSDLLDPVRNPTLYYHVQQLKLHREKVKEFINDTNNWQEEGDYED